MEHNPLFDGPRPRIIGLTGGIGSGKSVVARVLRLNGFFVYDCDSEASRIMEETLPVRQALTELLGEECWAGNGKLNRSHVAGKIFGDASLRTELNRVVHTAVKEDFAGQAFRRAASGMPVFCESAILATSGMDGMCEGIWIVSAPDDTRIERVCLRSGLKPGEVRMRMEAQTKETEALAPAKVRIVENDGRTPILPQVTALLEGLGIRQAMAVERTATYGIEY